MGLITILTDFGHRDAYVGVMKGVIAGIAPEARVIDLCHEIRPQAVGDAAFQLALAAPHFPPGTIHVAVVDPGVGSARRILCARTERALFLAPDNGLLSEVLAHSPALELYEVTERRFWGPQLSSTFHGRDIFAPVAAHLARGTSPDQLGPPCEEPRQLEPLPLARTAGRVCGAIRYVDGFGNLLSNIPAAGLPGIRAAQVGGRTIPGPLAPSYASAAPGGLVLIAGSSGYVEVAVCAGDAAAVLNVTRGATLELLLDTRQVEAL